MSMNRVCIAGRLTAAPELRQTNSGTPVANFRLAVDRDFKDANGEKQTDFIDVSAWRNTAEFVSQYFDKGRVAVVDGKLQTRKWTDKEGNQRTAVEIVADSVYFGDSKPSGTAPAQGYTPNSGGYTGANNAASLDYGNLDDDGDLPF